MFINRIGPATPSTCRSLGGVAARLVVLVATMTACGGARHADVPRGGTHAAYLGSAPGYLVLFRRAARFSPGEPLPEEPVREHSRYLLSLYRAGQLKLAGRFGDGNGGAMFFDAADDAAALALVKADPAVASGVFEFELRPWWPADWAERDVTWSR